MKDDAQTSFRGYVCVDSLLRRQLDWSGHCLDYAAAKGDIFAMFILLICRAPSVLGFSRVPIHRSTRHSQMFAARSMRFARCRERR